MSEAPRIVNGLKLPPKKPLKFPPKKVVQIVKHEDNGQKEWFFHPEAGEDVGPLSTYGLKGRISRETLVWKEGMTEWAKAGDMLELASVLASVKPELPPSIISEKWMWCLATLPITVSWLIAVFVGGSQGTQIVCAMVTIALNIIFMLLDIRELTKCGRNISGVLFLGLVLVPVYMFVRAAKYSKKYAAPIVWCVLFGLNILYGVIAREGLASMSTMLSSRLSATELAVKVKDAINTEYQSKTETRGVYQVKDLALVHDAGNMYHGLATVKVKTSNLVDANGNPVGVGIEHQEIKMNVDVTYDGENFIWQITPR